MNRSTSLFSENIYLSDGGLETTLIFKKGVLLNHFSAFELIKHEEGRRILEEYYEAFLEVAVKHNTGFVLESPTWRANSDWGIRLGYSHDDLFVMNKLSIEFMRDLEKRYSTRLPQLIISGNIGPRGDGYTVQNRMTSQQAKTYHQDQIEAFAASGADVVSAFTLNYCDEAIGIVEAARSFDLPVVISFTVETDGVLPSGESLRTAIERTDRETGSYTTHFMINCAHPRHFKEVLTDAGDWKNRIHGIRANASTKSHAEIDNSEVLDEGDKCLLSRDYLELLTLLPNLRVIGGCCGTDHEHILEIASLMMRRADS